MLERRYLYIQTHHQTDGLIMRISKYIKISTSLEYEIGMYPPALNDRRHSLVTYNSTNTFLLLSTSSTPQPRAAIYFTFTLPLPFLTPLSKKLARQLRPPLSTLPSYLPYLMHLQSGAVVSEFVAASLSWLLCLDRAWSRFGLVEK